MNHSSELEDTWRDVQSESPTVIQFTEVFQLTEAAKEKAEGAAPKARPAEVQIADILLRNDDFNFGVKRERALAFLKDALDKSPKDFAELLVNINAELAKRGSTLRLVAQCKEEKRIEEELFVPLELGLRPFKFPAKRTTENVATVRITNRFGELEDEAKIQGKPLKIEYNKNTRGEPEWKPLVEAKPPVSPFHRLRGQ
ncbi:MAG: hypothetical protein K2W95_29585 [Candidatus Obscuribacterales bacterium]|nr:hypothetical protein [Candidatus Obscuribacterales bacterium]